MKLEDFKSVLTEVDRDECKAVFTRSELRELVTDKSESALSRTLSKAVAEKLITRAVKGVYVFNDSHMTRDRVNVDLVQALRPNEYSYVSLESAANMWSIIPQIPFCLTLMTTGRSGTHYVPRFGRYVFTHTDNDVQKEIEEGRIFVYDYEDELDLARPDLVVSDLRRTNLHLELIDWESYDEAMEEAAAIQEAMRKEKEEAAAIQKALEETAKMDV